MNNGSLGAQLFVFILMALDQRRFELSQVEEIMADIRGAEPAEDEDA